MKQLTNLLTKLDITEAFKTKGDLKRWSAKRTVGGLLVITACNHIVAPGMGWEVVALCAIGVTPVCLSIFERK